MQSTGSALDACAFHLDKSCHSVNRASHALSSSSKDFDRLSRVLNYERHFDIVTESDIRQAQFQLQSEMEPQIRQLIQRAENGLEKLSKREEWFRKRLESQKSKNDTKGLENDQDAIERLSKQKQELEQKSQKYIKEVERKKRLIAAMEKQNK